MRVSVIIPTHNEAQAIGRVLADLPSDLITEISLGILLVFGLLTRPAAFVAFLFLGSLWISELGTSWIWELLVSVLASLGLAVGRAGRRWGVDAWLAQRRPSSLWW